MSYYFEGIFWNFHYELKKLMKIGMVSLFNDISTFVGYLMPMPSPQKNNGDII